MIRTEDEWMHHNPRPANVQHGQKRHRPLSPGDAAWISLALVLVGGAAVYVGVRILWGVG